MPASRHLKIPLLIFDGDDTLWDTMSLYSSAKAKLNKFLSLRGCDADKVAAFFEQEDQSNVPLMGFGLDRFEKSVRNTVAAFCPRASAHADEIDELVAGERKGLRVGDSHASRQ